MIWPDVKYPNRNAGLLGMSADFKQQAKKTKLGASLVAQWERIHLPRQETQVQSLVWEDPTYRGATKPVRHNDSVWALESGDCNY